MTGLETLVLIGKIITPLLVLGLSTAIKFLWDIKVNSKQVQEEFHNFKIQFTSEISSIKNKIDVLDSKTRDSYTKSDSDNRLLLLENKLMKEMTDQFTKLRDLIYSTLNRNRQTSKPDKVD